MQPAFGSAFGSAFGAGVDPTFAAAAAAGGFSSILDELSGELAPYVTFTRASTGARFNSAGLMEHSVPANAPRYDFDPTTVTRANLLCYSEDIGQPAAWTNNTGEVTLVRFQQGPSGSSNATLVSYASNLGRLSYFPGGSANTLSAGVYTFSFSIKNVDSTSVFVFNPETGSVVSVTSQLIVGEFVRVSLTFTLAADGAAAIQLRLGNGSVVVAEPQLERGSTATAYIPTGVLQRGPNVVVDDDFNDPAYWTTAGAATVSGGAANLVGTSQVYRNGSALVAGRAYEAEILVSSITGGVVAVRTNATTRGTTSVAGVFRVPFVATVTGERIEVSGNASAAASVDYLRIREVNYDYNSPRGDATLRGLLVEEQRTNLLLRSQEFDNAVWAVSTGTATKTANTDVAPDGTLTADTLAATSAGAVVWQTYTPTAGTAYVASVWVKRKVGTGTVEMTVNGSTYQAITITSDAFTRITLPPYTATAGTKAVGFRFATSGDAVAVWGAQLEAGAFATSYIPTTGAALTRSADVASAPLSSIGWNGAESTLFAEYIVPWSSPGATRGVAGVDSSGRFIYFTTGSGLIPAMFDGTNTATNSAISANASSKTISAFSSGGLALCSNGGAVNTTPFDGSFGSSPTALRIGESGQGSSTQLCGHIRRLRYYPRRLANAQLQAITA